MSRKSIVILLLILWFATFMSSCHVFKPRKERKIRQLSNIYREYPDLLTVDTVRYRDTVIVEKASIDTVFQQTSDTVKIETEKVRIKYKYDTITKKVFVQCDCKGDTIYTDRVIKIPCPTDTVLNYKDDDSLPWWVYVVGGALLLIITFLVIKK